MLDWCGVNFARQMEALRVDIEQSNEPRRALAGMVERSYVLSGTDIGAT